MGFIGNPGIGDLDGGPAQARHGVRRTDGEIPERIVDHDLGDGNGVRSAIHDVDRDVPGGQGNPAERQLFHRRRALPEEIHQAAARDQSREQHQQQ